MVEKLQWLLEMKRLIKWNYNQSVGVEILIKNCPLQCPLKIIELSNGIITIDKNK